jgi:hypothetical protein
MTPSVTCVLASHHIEEKITGFDSLPPESDTMAHANPENAE